MVLKGINKEKAAALMKKYEEEYPEGTPFVIACQIRCGDLYKPTNSSGAKIDEFSECVISEHHCVKQTKTNCPKPAMSVLDSKFNLKTDLTGVWYITRGLNSLFDCFDCQVHNFSYNPEVEPYTKPLHGDLKYNVKVLSLIHI